MPVQILSRPEGTYATKQQANSANIQSIAQVLSTAIQGYTKGQEDRKLRRAAATMLGVDENTIPVGMMTRENVAELQKEKYLQGLKKEEKIYEPKEVGGKIFEYDPTQKKYTITGEKVLKPKEQLEQDVAQRSPDLAKLLGTYTKVRSMGINPQGTIPKAIQKFPSKEEQGQITDVVKMTTPTKKMMNAPMIEKITKNENSYAALDDSANQLKANAEKFSQFMGPGKGVLRNPMRSYVNKDLPDFLAWKSAVQDAFQQYRVAVTGAQASDKEIRLLMQNRPSENDTYDVFLKKVNILNDVGKKVFNRYIQNLGKAGYDVSNYELAKIEPTIQLQGQPGSPQTGQGQYQEGQIYTDAQGNKAKYINGQFVEIK